ADRRDGIQANRRRGRKNWLRKEGSAGGINNRWGHVLARGWLLSGDVLAPKLPTNSSDEARKQDSDRRPIKQGPERTSSEPNKIGASTPYDFNGKNLTPYGGLLPVIKMLD